jgi:hypothetical protein
MMLTSHAMHETLAFNLVALGPIRDRGIGHGAAQRRVPHIHGARIKKPPERLSGGSAA